MRTHYLEQKRKWDSLATTWIDTGPPASPSNEDMQNYSLMLLDSLSTSTKGQVILLGCTPKIREMFATIDGLKDVNLTCVDFSEKMHSQTTTAMSTSNPNETFILDNWLDFDLGKHKFDAILGDKAIDNIMPDDWDRFFSQIYYHLRPSGSFIVHLALADKQFKNISFNDALDKWVNMRMTSNQSLEQIASGLWEDLLTASAYKDGYHNTVTISRFSKEVEAYSDEIGIVNEYQQEVFNEFKRLFWKSKEDLWASYQYQEILDAMSKYFSHTQTLYSHDYDVAKVQPIIRMTTKYANDK